MNKRLFLSFLSALLLFSCNKQAPSSCGNAEGPVESIVNLEVLLPSDTKSSYLELLSYERNISSLQILVFDENGKLDKYYGNASTTQKLETAAGAKTIYAVANAPSLSQITEIEELQTYRFSLSDNSRTSGLVMAGVEDCVLSAGEQASCTILLSRLVARVALVKITNKLPSAYGDILIESAWLANVPASCALEGAVTDGSWLNRYSRCDETPQQASHIIDGNTYKASCEELTYGNISLSLPSQQSYNPSSPLCLYAGPNPSTLRPQDFSTTFVPQMTMIVLRTKVQGQTMYYGIPLDKQTVDSNSAYTVSVTLTGIGSDEPQHIFEQSEGIISVTVEPWAEGVYYDTTI